MTNPSNSSLASIPLPVLERIDAVCSSFESELNSDRIPQIEDFLKSDSEEEHHLLLRELLHLELTKKKGLGLSATQVEYEARFAAYPDVVREAFEDDTGVDSVAAPQDQVQFGGDNRVGELVAERYQVVSLLGSGGFSDVYLAEDTKSLQQVALKVLKPNGAADADSLLAEANVLADLEHPNIAHAYDSGRVDGMAYIAMRFVDGKTLAETIKEQQQSKENPLRVEQAVRWTMEICDALQFAHQQGLTHRDIKPHNVLIDSNQNAVVADFGFALREADQEQHFGDRSGTPYYRSPEQVRGEADWLDGRSDVWSVGVVLYEMLAGQRPFRGYSLEEIDRQILQRPAKPLRQIDPSIPAWLDAICLKCLDKSPQSRYPTASALAHALRHKKHPLAQRVNRFLVAAVALLVVVSISFGFIARRGSQHALEATERYVRNVHDKMNGVPGKKNAALRESALQNALLDMEEFGASGRRADLLRVSLQIRLAKTQRQQKNSAAATANIHESITILERNLRQIPPRKQPPVLRLLGITYDMLGDIEKNSDAATAIDYYQQARAYRAKWLEIASSDVDVVSSSPFKYAARDAPEGIDKITELEHAQQGLGTSHLTLGQMYRRDPARVDDALASFQDLVAIRESIFKAHPKLLYSQKVYAGALRDLATAQGSKGDYDSAISNLDESIVLLRGVINSIANDPTADPGDLLVSKYNITVHLRSLSDIFFRIGQREAAIDALEEAVEDLEHLQNNYDTNSLMLQRIEFKLAQCYYSLGLLNMSQKAEAAEGYFEKSTMMFSKRDNAERMFPLARLHRREEASQIADAHFSVQPSVADVFTRGRLYAVCAWSAQVQNHGSEFSRFRDLAIRDFEQTLESGVTPSVIRDDPELQFLQSEIAYRDLMTK